jgi:uncharacterized protein (DUF58 family)
LPAATPERILQRLDWQVIRRLDGLLQGDYRSLFYGFGVDFADLREYQPEDDIRYIDWNVTARMNTPYVRQYVEDREIAGWFLLDLSPSVDFGSQESIKRSMLIDFVATLARLLTRHGNRVGALFYTGQNNSGYSDHRQASRGQDGRGQDGRQSNGHRNGHSHPRIERTIPARSGRNHVLRLVNDLLKQPPLPHAQFTDLTPLLDGGLHAIKRRSLIFIISDFICSPGWERPLNLLSQHHEVLAIRLWDPREAQLPDIGPIILEDAETGEQMYVDTHDRRFRQRFEEAARRREADLRGVFKRAGVDALSLSTQEDLVSAIVRFAMSRKQRRR